MYFAEKIKTVSMVRPICKMLIKAVMADFQAGEIGTEKDYSYFEILKPNKFLPSKYLIRIRFEVEPYKAGEY